MKLKCYEIDWAENKHAWDRKCQPDEAKKVMNKLLRHFKLYDVSIYFDKNRNGSANYTYNYIRLPRKNIPLGMMNHEVAHLVCHKKYNAKGHRKKFMKALKIVNNYAKKKDYFDKFIDWSK